MILPDTDNKIEMQAQIVRERFYFKGIRKREKGIRNKQDHLSQWFFFF